MAPSFFVLRCKGKAFFLFRNRIGGKNDIFSFFFTKKKIDSLYFVLKVDKCYTYKKLKCKLKELKHCQMHLFIIFAIKNYKKNRDGYI